MTVLEEEALCGPDENLTAGHFYLSNVTVEYLLLAIHVLILCQSFAYGSWFIREKLQTSSNTEKSMAKIM